MLFDGMSNSTFESNTVIRNASVPVGGVTHVREANFVNNFTDINNTFSVQGGTLALANDGEVLNTEDGGPDPYNNFRGIVTGATTSGLSDSGQHFFQSGNTAPALRSRAVVALVSGQGKGQGRTVSAIASNGKDLTLSSPWTVPPSPGDHYATFDWSAEGWIVANNNMTGNNKGIEFFNSSVHDVLIEANTLTDDSGILLSPNQSLPGIFGFVIGVEITNNKLSDTKGLRPAYIGVIPREDSQLNSFGTAIMGVEIRNNTIIAHLPNTAITNTSLDDSKALVEGLNCYWQWQTMALFSPSGSTTPIEGALFQNNTVQNSSTAIYLNSGVFDSVFQNTILGNVSHLSTDEVIPGATTASAGTLY